MVNKIYVFYFIAHIRANEVQWVKKLNNFFVDGPTHTRETGVGKSNQNLFNIGLTY